MVDTGVDVSQAMSALGIESVDDTELVALCQRIVAANPKIAADVRSGKMQAIGALVGQAKKSNPNVDPNRVREICLELIGTAST
jgi:aspartyl-tRNA(Asn)/glutamyl-tRNA(Gln) amidotransferase subunit B